MLATIAAESNNSFASLAVVIAKLVLLSSLCIVFNKDIIMVTAELQENSLQNIDKSFDN